MQNTKVKHGEIYCFDFGNNEGSIQNGIRPALVIQANNFNANSPTTVIAAITTAQKGMYLPSHIFLGESYGLMGSYEYNSIGQCGDKWIGNFCPAPSNDSSCHRTRACCYYRCEGAAIPKKLLHDPS